MRLLENFHHDEVEKMLRFTSRITNVFYGVVRAEGVTATKLTFETCFSVTRKYHIRRIYTGSVFKTRVFNYSREMQTTRIMGELLRAALKLRRRYDYPS